MKKIAVLVPCYNEELTIANVIEDFHQHLPEADIYVYDNNSSDKTAQVALEHGAIVVPEYQQGKHKKDLIGQPHGRNGRCPQGADHQCCAQHVP